MKVNKHLKVQGEIKDRGVIKWQGMMLTEHVELIRAWYEEDKYDAKLDLDESDPQLLQEELVLAAQRQGQVRLKPWKGRKFRYHIYIIQEVSRHSRSITYLDSLGIYQLPMDK